MSAQCGVKALNEYLFDQLGITGNRDKYEDPRNSCLIEVLERRTGIPLTLSHTTAAETGRRGEGTAPSRASACSIARPSRWAPSTIRFGGSAA